jgi:hypothetical protein
METYPLIGGGRDGSDVRVDGPLPPGAQLRLPTAHDAARCEVYIMGEDGRLRFDRYAPAAAARPVGPAPDELKPLVARLGAALLDLEAAYAARGLAPPPMRVNHWLLLPRQPPDTPQPPPPAS